MDITTDTFFDTLPVSLKLIVLTLILVLVLLLIFWIIRRLFGNSAKNKISAPVPRLAVIDAANVDDKRRLVLIRRDDVEHLVMIGGTTDVLIESNIEHPIPARIQESHQSFSQNTSQITHSEEHPDISVSTDAKTEDADSFDSKTDTPEKSGDQATPSPAASSWRDRVKKTTIVGAVTSQSGEGGVSDIDLSTINETDSGEAEDRESSDTNPSQEINEDALANLTDALDVELAGTSDLETATTPSISKIAKNLSEPEKKEAEPVENWKKDETESKEPPKKRDMEDEMQRLLNELTGEKT